ncbi:transposase [Emticicia sp. 21SJ11W-3]|nr:transposase [Emticicia sp. 21SJ11W-3]UTA67288.1 transposase [Emticicia sp. 21SJ11W-3]
MAEKDKKEFINDLKPVYQSLTKDEGFENLIALDNKWAKKYPGPIQSWYNNWENLSTFFQYLMPLERSFIPQRRPQLTPSRVSTDKLEKLRKQNGLLLLTMPF